MKYINKNSKNGINDRTIFSHKPVSRELQDFNEPISPFRKKVDKFLTVVLHITCIYGIYNVSSQVADNISSINKTQNVNKDLFYQNIFGVPYLMETDGKPIDVVVNENFSDEQKDIISKSISSLDEKLVGLDYNIILDNTKSNKNCITINSNIDHQNKEEDECYGVTYTKFPVFGTKLIFPVEIKLNLDEINNSYNGAIAKAKTYDQFLGSIVKHEMLHTLGLKDLYDYAENGKSIMYGYTTAKSLNDPSEEEINTINTVYPSNGNFDFKDINAYISTTVGEPEKFTFEYLKNKKENTENINGYEPEM